MDKDAGATHRGTVHDLLQQARHGVATLAAERACVSGRMAALQEDVTILRERTDRLRRAIRDVREEYTRVPAPAP